MRKAVRTSVQVVLTVLRLHGARGQTISPPPRGQQKVAAAIGSHSIQDRASAKAICPSLQQRSAADSSRRIASPSPSSPGCPLILCRDTGASAVPFSDRIQPPSAPQRLPGLCSVDSTRLG
jgi:hypothetical protein